MMMKKDKEAEETDMKKHKEERDIEHVNQIYICSLARSLRFRIPQRADM